MILKATVVPVGYAKIYIAGIGERHIEKKYMLMRIRHKERSPIGYGSD